MTKEKWEKRRQKFGPSGCNDPTSLAVMKGKHHSEKSKNKASQAINVWYSNPDNHAKFLEAHHEAHLGVPMSEEQKAKLSLSQKGYHNAPQTEFKKGHSTSDEVRRKISATKKGNSVSWMKGKHHTAEAVEKNRLAHTGKVTSPETRLKMSESHKRRLMENPDLVPYKVVARRHSEQGGTGYVSERQGILFGIVKGIFPDAVMEYPINTGKTVRYADVAVPSQRIDFEYDSSLHKRFVTGQREARRNAELYALDWSVVHVDDRLLRMMQRGGGR